MALRKKLKATTSTAEPPQEYDANRFVGFAAQKMYLDLVVKKGVNTGKGTTYVHGQHVQAS